MKSFMFNCRDATSLPPGEVHGPRPQATGVVNPDIFHAGQADSATFCTSWRAAPRRRTAAATHRSLFFHAKA
jgi:hypothetical protein